MREVVLVVTGGVGDGDGDGDGGGGGGNVGFAIVSGLTSTRGSTGTTSGAESIREPNSVRLTGGGAVIGRGTN